MGQSGTRLYFPMPSSVAAEKHKFCCKRCTNLSCMFNIQLQLLGKEGRKHCTILLYLLVMLRRLTIQAWVGFCPLVRFVAENAVASQTSEQHKKNHECGRPLDDNRSVLF